MSSPIAGWYQNPDNSEEQRWWDGEHWTDRCQPLPAAEPEAPVTHTLGNTEVKLTSLESKPLELHKVRLAPEVESLEEIRRQKAASPWSQPKLPANPAPIIAPPTTALSRQKPLGTLLQIITVLTTIFIAVQVAMAAAIINAFFVFGDANQTLDNQGFSLETVHKVNQALDWVDLFQYIGIGLLLLTGIFVIAWLHRAYKNMLTWRRGSYSSASTIWSWFVPIFSLIRPKEILNEINDSFLAATPALQAQTRKLLDDWWRFWLLEILFSFVARGLDSTELEQIRQPASSSPLSSFESAVSFAHWGLLAQLLIPLFYCLAGVFMIKVLRVLSNPVQKGGDDG